MKEKFGVFIHLLLRKFDTIVLQMNEFKEWFNVKDF